MRPPKTKARGLEKSTRERLLENAELLYSRQGIQATSLREITERAKANLAAVNYHFRSKDALTEAVFSRRLEPLNRERLRLLDEAEALADGGKPSLEAVLRALFVPEFRLWEEAPQFVRLAGRLQYEPGEKLHRLFLAQFDEVIRRFDSAMARAVPEVPRKELYWRTHFLFGAVIHTWLCQADVEAISGGLCKVSDSEDLLEQLMAFGVTGLRAPLPASHRK